MRVEVEIARSLDALLMPSPHYAKLASLPVPEEIELADAIDLASRGLVIGAALSARPERAPYIRALFDLDGHVARDHERRLSFALVLELVDRIGGGVSVTPRQIRLAMLSLHTAGGPLAIPDHLRPTAERWRLFQLRQLQRYALEAWLYLVEWNMLGGPHTARDFADDFARLASKHDAGLARLIERPVGEIVPAYLEHGRIADVAAWSVTDAGDTPWGLYIDLRDALAEERRDRAVAATWNLTIAVLALADALVDDDNAFTAIGGRRRISLVHFKQWWACRREMKPQRALEDMIEELVLQQHVAVAVSRFDNEKRRLRFSNDECGWEALPGTLPSKPSRTPDRILAMLSLLSDLALAAQVDERFTVTNAGRDLLRVVRG